MARPSLGTAPQPRSLADIRRARRIRRIGLAGIWLVVLAGLGGLLGVRTGSTAAMADGYRLQVNYPQITRAGLAAPYDVRVTRAGGFGDSPITLAVSRELFTLFDFQNFYPVPTGETADTRFIYYTFDPPPGDMLAWSLDARTAPDRNGGTVRVETALIVDERELTRVRFRVWVAP